MAEIQAGCTICLHEQSAAIDAELIAGTPLRTIAGTFAVSRSALSRHRQAHLVADLVPAGSGSGVEALEPLDVLLRLQQLVARLEAALVAAEKARKPAVIVAVGRELRQTLEATSRQQSDPDVVGAVFGDAFRAGVADGLGRLVVDVVTFVLGVADLTGQAWTDLVRQALRVRAEAGADGGGTDLASAVDLTAVRAWLVDRDAQREQAVEAEIARRVAVEVARRMALPPVLALPPGRPAVPVTDDPGAALVTPPSAGDDLPASRPSASRMPLRMPTGAAVVSRPFP